MWLICQGLGVIISHDLCLPWRAMRALATGYQQVNEDTHVDCQCQATGMLMSFQGQLKWRISRSPELGIPRIATATPTTPFMLQT